MIMATGTKITANGMSAGTKSLGTVPKRPLGRITEKVAMPAFVKATKNDSLHHQAVCASMNPGMKGSPGWKINGNEAKVSGPAINTWQKAVNYKDPQRAKK